MAGRFTALLAAAVAALAVGCGDDAEREAAYAAAVSAAKERFDGRVASLTARITPDSSPEDDRATLRAFRAEIERATAAMRRIEAPESVAGLHEELVRSVGAYGPEIDRAREGLAADSLPDVQAAQQHFARAAAVLDNRVRRTIARINERLRG